MTAVLRVVLDQLIAPTDVDIAAASRGLARGLVEGAPAGCEVAAIVPAGGAGDAVALVPGLAEVRRAPLGRRELAAAWQFGSAPRVGGGMIHSPSLLAPLVKHDRVHDNDQTVVTVWDLRAWDTPSELPRTTVSWQRGMLARAVRYADAVVVPTHTIAERLGEIARLGNRIRVIAGAAPDGGVASTDAVGRARSLALPVHYLLLAGGVAPSDGLAAGLAGAAEALRSQPDVEVVVIDSPPGEEPAIAELASAAGIPERRVHVRGTLDPLDRAAVFAGAMLFAASARRAGFPWRVLDALAAATPLVAVASPVHREVIVDGGLVVGDADSSSDADALGAAMTRVAADHALRERLRVLAADRSRSFSWREAADRVWQLHAEL